MMNDFLAGNERVYGPFMRFAQKVTLKTMPNDAEIDRNIEMFTSQLETFPNYVEFSDRVGSYHRLFSGILSFTKQVNEVKSGIKRMRDSPTALDSRDIAHFKAFLHDIDVFFEEMQGNLAIYFQSVALAKGKRGKSIKEDLTDLLQHMTTIVDRLPS